MDRGIFVSGSVKTQKIWLMKEAQIRGRRVISTEEMVKALVADADNEHEYRHVLGGILFSTHWFVYDSTKGEIGHSTDWYRYSWCSCEELLEAYHGHWWIRDV